MMRCDSSGWHHQRVRRFSHREALPRRHYQTALWLPLSRLSEIGSSQFGVQCSVMPMPMHVRRSESGEASMCGIDELVLRAQAAPPNNRLAAEITAAGTAKMR